MTILAELHSDHVNLGRLLEILSAKVAKLRAGTRPNYQLMADAISYIGDYAAQDHHLREDRMLAYFQGRDTKLDELTRQCEAQHQKLNTLSHHLYESIESVLNDTLMPMELLIDQLEAYVVEYKNHMEFEEKQLFPCLESVAQASDWQTLREQLPRNDDPLFGEHQSEQYVELYRDLLRDMAR
ncbi:hemerythrin domain-containing protein [Marinobacterium rhizophilum]|uniref:hemerythrin domain-containing protein n=1 Tax=Marinobacterium rhizophilum TaxID=420402 RepID=UPI00036CC37C|nr:hemerythrin domain-containing protein [Marinobacterium rhizophilum]